MTRRTHLRISADNNSPADAIRARPSSLPSPSPPPLSHHCANFSFFNLASLPLPLPPPPPPPRRRIFVLRRASVLISFAARRGFPTKESRGDPRRPGRHARLSASVISLLIYLINSRPNELLRPSPSAPPPLSLPLFLHLLAFRS